MSADTSLTYDELVKMVKTLADVKASMPPRHRGVIKKEYGVDVQVGKTLGMIQYTASGRRLMPDFVFVLEKGEGVKVVSYNAGDWEVRLKKAYDDLVAQSGVFGRLSVILPEPTSDTEKETRSPGERRPQKNEGLFQRLWRWFF